MAVVLYSSPLLRRPNAAEFPGTTPIDTQGVAWHYGDPLGEQRLMATQPVVIDRSHRAVLSVSGPDAPTFLNNLLSQKLDDAQAGFAAQALDLDIQGRILHHVDIVFDGEVFYLDLPRTQLVSFEDFLRKMVFWSQVEITEEDLGILTVLAPATTLPDFTAAHPRFVREVEPWTQQRRFDLAVPRDGLDAAVDALLADGASLAGLMTFSAERVRAGEPELAADLDAKSIPHEAPRLINRASHIGAVHLNKGCYRGQETVARVENIGRSPRLLVLLHLDGSAPGEPGPGATITSGGRNVGRLGTVVHDADYGPVALALVKRSALEQPLEIVLETGAVAAQVDQDSLPVDEGEKAGRRAQEQLRAMKRNS